MFDFNKLGDLSQIAGQARQMQEKQERLQQEQLMLLKKISEQLSEVLSILKEKWLH